MRHFISISDTSPQELQHVLDVAFALRTQRGQGGKPLLAQKSIALFSEKPSLRTRVSFEQAMVELGGHTIVLSANEVGIGKRESPADVARVLSGMVHGIVARVFEHQKLLDLAKYSSVPVINALSDYSHPCQALADAMTMMDEFGRDLRGRTVVFVGDGNNVARSLANIAAKLGMRFILSSPDGYQLDHGHLERLRSQGAAMELVRDPRAAVKEADAIYTDTWVSMGQEAQAAERRSAFLNYQVNTQLVSAAPKHAIVLHCLPAYRNVEITDDVLDGPQSRAFPQANNRLHAQKGLLAVLLGGM